MKLKTEFKETDNSTVYRRSRWQHLATTGKSQGNWCPICPPKKGCNRRFRKDRNWKCFRKTQYKEVDASLSPIPKDLQEMYDIGLIPMSLMLLLSECPRIWPDDEEE